MEERRLFLKKTALATAGLFAGNALNALDFSTENFKKFDFKISLAEWSMHKALFAGEMTNLDFPKVSKLEYGIDAVEYVNQFFKDKAQDFEYLKQLRQRSDDFGVKNVLIMVDGEGFLSDKDNKVRQNAVDNHLKWIEASKFLGGHAIRVNLHGDSNEKEWHEASVKSLTQLAEFADKMEMNILAENHGLFSSHAGKMVEVMKAVSHKRCGTMVDFANFCFRRENGDIWESPCVEMYDKYKGVEELMPYARAVSAKTFNFDQNGNESKSDFKKLLQTVKSAGYKGYVAVEYEGDRLNEPDGIKASKKLLEKIRNEL